MAGEARTAWGPGRSCWPAAKPLETAVSSSIIAPWQPAGLHRVLQPRHGAELAAGAREVQERDRERPDTHPGGATPGPGAGSFGRGSGQIGFAECLLRPTAPHRPQLAAEHPARLMSGLRDLVSGGGAADACTGGGAGAAALQQLAKAARGAGPSGSSAQAAQAAQAAQVRSRPR